MHLLYTCFYIVLIFKKYISIYLHIDIYVINIGNCIYNYTEREIKWMWQNTANGLPCLLELESNGALKSNNRKSSQMYIYIYIKSH